MPKQILQVKDFSGGLNTLKDPADININELQDVENLTVTTQGSINPSYKLIDSSSEITSMPTLFTVTGASYNNGTTITHATSKIVAVGLSVSGTGIPSGSTVSSVTSSTQFVLSQTTTGGSQTDQTLTLDLGIDSVEPNYGLGCFETDFARDSSILTLTADHSSCNHASSACVSPNGFKLTGGNVLSAVSGSSAVDLTSYFPIGVFINLSIPTAQSFSLSLQHSGIYSIVAHSGNNVILNKSQSIPAGANGIFYASGTIVSYEQGDTVTLIADNDTHKIHTFSTKATSWKKDEITLRSSESGNSSKVKYYKANEAIRCCDTSIKSDCKIQWYGWIQRRHFEVNPYDTSTNTFLGYYSKDNTLEPPTELTLTTVNDSATGNVVTVNSLSAGGGFAMHITSENDQDGTIPSGIKYEFAETFIYDNNQESLPAAMSSTITPGTDLKSFSINIGTKGPFDPRITGGRIYIREADRNEEYIMLVDIDLSKGARTKLSDNYTQWYDNGAAVQATYYCPTQNHADNFIVRELGSFTYEVLNGFSSSIFSHAIGDQGENWKDCTVSNNRAFVCNVTIKDENTGSTKNTASLTTFPDRIMYSMPNRFDTFPYHNYIEAAKADAETYVAIDAYADRLLAYKQYSLDIINISSPDDSNWFLEDSKKYLGVSNPECVKRTQYGILWINKQGLHLYNGNTIINLKENKISDSDWETLNTDNTSIIYDEQESTAYLLQSTSLLGTELIYVVDLKKGTFVKSNSFIDTGSGDGITNSVDKVTDTIVARDEGSGLKFYRINRNYKTATAKLQTKDIDFGDPSATKRIYAVYITYKSDDALTGYFTIEEPDGTSHSLSGTVATSSSNWAVAKLEPSSTCDVSKASIKLNTGSDVRLIYINDISIQYRTIYKRVV